MNFVSIIKRVAPFFLTLTIGLFITSFFVAVTAPNFSVPTRSWRNKHRDYHRQMQFELRQLREENSRLKTRNAELQRQNWVINPEFELDVPPPPVAPAAPSMPMKGVPSKSK